MKAIMPSIAILQAIQRVNALVQQEHGTSAYASIGTGNMGAIVIGTPDEILALANQMQQTPPIAAVAPAKALRPAHKALRPTRKLLAR